MKTIISSLPIASMCYKCSSMSAHLFWLIVHINGVRICLMGISTTTGMQGADVSVTPCCVAGCPEFKVTEDYTIVLLFI